MVKFIPVLLIIAVVLGGFLYWRYSAKQTLVQSTAQVQITGEGLLEDRVAQLELAVIEIIKNSRGVVASDSDKDAIDELKSQVTSLQYEVDTLKKTSGTTTSTPQSSSQTTTTTATTAKAPVYIPLGWIGSATSTDWSNVTGQEISIDPADYPGYKNVYFEVALRIFQNGKAYARLQNKDDGTALLSSEVSTTATDYTWLTSAAFQLPGAKKTYRLQLKSLTGYSSDVQNARIKIVY